VSYSAGYQSQRIVDERRSRPIHLDLWYPAQQPEREHPYGLGSGRVAHGAPIAPGRFPIALLSHGAMGTASNYSWLAEHLARRGLAVAGVSHFAESPVFGLDTIEPTSVGRFGDRTRDLITALEFAIERSPLAAALDPERIAAIGHSSGGASVLMLAGAEFSAAELAAYCRSSAAEADKGCSYAKDAAPESPAHVPVPSPHRIAAIVAMDPAVGPGFSERGLRAIAAPTLVIGSVHNDFLPYPFHAGRIAAQVSGAEVVRLDAGEGHFVYLDACSVPLEAMGVPLFRDRPGVDRNAVHERLAIAIAIFLARHLAPV
jgi:predicted dienelactone hydrolase